jgi:PIN domain nuclease of toxin-antitoxin system
MTSHVIDASAALAWILDEPGSDRVAPHLVDGLMSAVNLSEIVARLVRAGADPMRAHYLGSRIVPFDVDLADRAGRLWPVTAALGLSLGDRACLALAQREQLPVLTADRAWAELSLGVDVIVVR